MLIIYVYIFVCVCFLVFVLLISVAFLVLFSCVGVFAPQRFSALQWDDESASGRRCLSGGKYFREAKHTVDWVVMLNHPLSVTMNNSRLYTPSLQRYYWRRIGMKSGHLGKNVLRVSLNI